MGKAYFKSRTSLLWICTIHLSRWGKRWVLICPDFPNRLKMGFLKLFCLSLIFHMKYVTWSWTTCFSPPFWKAALQVCIEAELPVFTCLLWLDEVFHIWAFHASCQYFFFKPMKGKNLNSKCLLPSPCIFLGYQEIYKGRISWWHPYGNVRPSLLFHSFKNSMISLTDKVKAILVWHLTLF